MRTTQRDQGGVVAFGAVVVGNQNSAGVAQPGAIPYTSTRVAAGAYQIRVDPRLMVLSGVVAHGGGGGALSTGVSQFGAGTLTVSIYNSASAGVDPNAFDFQVTAKDTR